MSEKILDGEFQGVVVGHRWTKWEDEENDKRVPLLSFDVEVTQGEIKTKLHPTLFFDTDFATSGMDAGKSRVQISLEVLESYGLEVNPDEPSDNSPHLFGPGMIGKTVSLFCKEKDGKQVCYLNRGRKPELEEKEVAALWSEICGEPAKPKDKAKPKSKKSNGEDKEELVF